ncbi:MAG: hypothetical protein Q4E50_03305 [Tissierellia bacterium]|nr:hypothetical protein [Tissierellia bacterium]
MIANPYLCKVNTQILKKLNPHGKIHVALKADISIDYKKHNSFQEKTFINGEPVEKIYDSSLGKVYIISKNPKSNYVDLSLDYDTRLRILKSFTCRYLINAVLEKYIGLRANNFVTEEDRSSFFIRDLQDEEKIKETTSILQRIIANYIQTGLDINTRPSDDGYLVEINGIYKGRQVCPHLSNLSEIVRFNIIHYEIKSSGVTFYYNN